MKRAMMLVITVLLPGFGSASAATDYSGCSDEKLNGVRGTPSAMNGRKERKDPDQWYRCNALRPQAEEVQNCRSDMMRP